MYEYSVFRSICILVLITNVSACRMSIFRKEILVIMVIDKLHSAELQRTISSPISNCRHSKLAILVLCNITQVCYVRIQVRLGRMCGFQECDQIATPLAGFSCAACVTNTSAAVMSELLPYLLYSVGMHA